MYPRTSTWIKVAATEVDSGRRQHIGITHAQATELISIPGDPPITHIVNLATADPVAELIRVPVKPLLSDWTIYYTDSWHQTASASILW